MQEHIANIRYVSVGLFLSIMGPVLMLYGAFTLIMHNGDHMIDWIISRTPLSTMTQETPSGVPALQAPQQNRPEFSPRRIALASAAQANWEPRPEWIEDQYTEEIDRTIPMEADGRFSLSNISGSIVVTSWTRNEARIYARKTARARDEEEAREAMQEVEIEIDTRGGDVDVRTRYPDRRDGWWGNRPHISVYYEVTVPETATLRLNSVSGDVDVSKMRGEVEATSVSGSVRVKDISNRVRIESTSGNVEARNLRGETDLKSVSGYVEVESVAGDLDARSTSGRVELRDVTARRLSAKSTSGTIVFEGQIINDGVYDMETTSGSIRLVVPADASFDLRANTFSGSIDSDLPITLRGSVSSRSGHRKNLNGAVNGGGADVDLSAFSGDIVIRKR